MSYDELETDFIKTKIEAYKQRLRINVNRAIEKSLTDSGIPIGRNDFLYQTISSLKESIRNQFANDSYILDVIRDNAIKELMHRINLVDIT